MVAFRKDMERLQPWGKDTVTANIVRGTASLGWVAAEVGGFLPTEAT